MTNPIRYLVISDIHLGHHRNPTRSIIERLDRFITRQSDVDIIFLAGDVFDRLLDFNSSEVNDIVLWVSRLLTHCSQHDILLRVLEGTPSHDWGQSRIFESMAQASRLTIDVRYVYTLSIEHIKKYDLRVLYVPDEWHSDTRNTYRQVLELLSEQQLTQVDIAIMHGAFNYQLPAAATAVPRHDEHDYLSIVKYFIHIGHIHTYSVFERIIAEGSFDRLAHNEEEPKGAVRVHLYPDRPSEYWFIENAQACLFRTLRLRQSTLEQAIKKLDRLTQAMPKGSYVRICAPRNHPALVAFDALKRRYIDIVLTKQAEERSQSPLFVSTPVYTAITLGPENLDTMLREVISAKYSLTDTQWQLYQANLQAATLS